MRHFGESKVRVELCCTLYLLLVRPHQILYFMCGFAADASLYFFFVFVVWVGRPYNLHTLYSVHTLTFPLVQLACLVLISLGLLMSALLSTVALAQGGAFLRTAHL